MNLCMFVEEVAVCNDHDGLQEECEMFDPSSLSSGMEFTEYKLCRHCKGHFERTDKSHVFSHESFYRRCQHPEAALMMKMGEL